MYKRNYWKYPYRRWKSNGVKRRAVQTIRASNSQNSTINFAIKVNYAFTAAYDSSTQHGVAAINIYDVLMSSQNFQNLRKMYDNVKINGVNVRLNVTDAATSLNDISAMKSINVLTAWDKSGLSVEEIEFKDSSNNVIVDTDYDTNKPAVYCNKIGNKITGYGSVKKGLLNMYQKFTRYERCWPTTNNEKSLYIPTRMFNEFNSGYDANSAYYSISGDYTNQVVNDLVANPNPCIPFENVAVPWKPTLLVGVFKTSLNNNGSLDQYGNCSAVVFNAEFTIPCTFKGLKGDK